MKKAGLLLIVICSLALLTAAVLPVPDVVVKGGTWYDVRAYSDFSTALTAVGSDTKTVLVVSNNNIASDTTVPANVNLWCVAGGKFTIASGKSLTVNGSISAGNHTIFVGPGTLVASKQTLQAAWLGGLAAAVPIISSNPAALEVSQSETISDNLTVPSTVALSLTGAAQLTIADTKTLTINGPFDAPSRQVFLFNTTGKAIPSNLQELRAVWWPSLSKAVADLGSNDRTLLISRAETVSGSIAYPANISFRLLRGGSFAPAGAVAVTINGQLSAGPYQIFTGAGTVIIPAGALTEEFPIEWWGADPTGVADSSTAINAAFTALAEGLTVRFKSGGVYNTGTTTVTLNKGLNIRAKGATISYAGSNVCFYITPPTETLELYNVSLEGLTIQRTTRTWDLAVDTSSVGLKVENVMESVFRDYSIINFWHGLEHRAKYVSIGGVSTRGGSSWTRFYPVHMFDNYIGHYVEGESGNNAWVTNGQITGGRWNITHGVTHSACQVYIKDSGYPHNNYKLEGCSLETQVGAVTWYASHDLPVGQFVRPWVPNQGLVYEITGSTGVAGLTQPTWPTTAGDTITDGGKTYTARAMEAVQQISFHIEGAENIVSNCRMESYTGTTPMATLVGQNHHVEGRGTIGNYICSFWDQSTGSSIFAVNGSVEHIYSSAGGNKEMVFGGDGRALILYNTSSGDLPVIQTYNPSKTISLWSVAPTGEQKWYSGGGVYQVGVSAGTGSLKADKAYEVGTFFRQPGTAEALTIATGEITVTKGNITVDTEASAADDDVVTINGGAAGDMLIMRAVNSARSIIIRGTGGNITCKDGGDGVGCFILDSTDDVAVFWRTGANWQLLSAMDNG